MQFISNQARRGYRGFSAPISSPSSRQDRGLSFLLGWQRWDAATGGPDAATGGPDAATGGPDAATGGPVGGCEVRRLSLLPPSGPRFRSLLRPRDRSGFGLLNH